MDGGHGVICRCVGYYGEEDAPSRRLARPLVFCRTPGACPLENGYARPVEGIHVLVDMRQMKVKSWTNLYAIFAEFCWHSTFFLWVLLLTHHHFNQSTSE
jgi:hypothetical protein